MLIVIAGQKGGGGKTTIATNFAVMRLMQKRDILLYDVDPQKTATLWASRRDENTLLPRVNSSQKILDKQILNVGTVIRNEILSLKPKYDDIIIDAGGADNEALRASLSLAEVAVFPIIPSDFDMWTFETLSNLVASAQGKENLLQASVLLNKVNTNTLTAQKELSECDEYLQDFENIKRFKNHISERIAVRRSSGQGMAIIEYQPKDQKACSEMNRVYKEVFHGKNKKT
jgi:chromosome partitioning protein